MTRAQAIEILTQYPVGFGRALGFTKLGALHNEWMIDMLSGRSDSTLQASRGTYKTTCVSVAIAIIIILKPRKKTLFMRKTDEDVKEVIRQVQKILETPIARVFAQAVWGVAMTINVKSATAVNTSLSLDIRGANQLTGMGTGSSLTGKHYDYIFTDDIVNLQDRISKAERDRTKAIYQELQNIKNRGGRIINSGTPWHPNDCFEIMPPPKKYDCYNPAFENIFTPEVLEAIKAGMTKSLFAANYELRHVAEDDVIFTDPVTDYDPIILNQAKNCHIDAAYGGGDFTAFTICKKTEGKYYVLGKLWNKHVDDVLPEIIKIRQGFNAGRIYCEDNGDKGYLMKELKRRGERATTYHESMNKFLKITSYLKSEWNSVIFIAGTDEEYIRQICDYNENAEHDDAPDSLASIIRLLWGRRGSDETPKLLW